MKSLTINEILEKEADGLLEEQLACFSELNLLTTFTPDELDMTREEMDIAIQKQKALTDKLVVAKNTIDHWRSMLNANPGSEETYKQQIMEECPWLKTRIEKKILPVTELNHAVIAHINNALNEFCFGRFKEEEDYPVAMTKTQITSGDATAELNISVDAKKRYELLSHILVTITLKSKNNF